MPNKTTRIDAPPLTFSEWTRWSDRPRLRGTDGRPGLGLYLWSYFENTPPSGVPYPDLPEQLIYVGETKHLDRRPLTEPHHRLVHLPRHVCQRRESRSVVFISLPRSQFSWRLSFAGRENALRGVARVHAIHRGENLLGIHSTLGASASVALQKI
jgi:hypothetical protein